MREDEVHVGMRVRLRKYLTPEELAIPDSPGLTPEMRSFLGKEYIVHAIYRNGCLSLKNGGGYTWHVRWLEPICKLKAKRKKEKEDKERKEKPPPTYVPYTPPPTYIWHTNDSATSADETWL